MITLLVTIGSCGYLPDRVRENAMLVAGLIVWRRCP